MKMKRIKLICICLLTLSTAAVPCSKSNRIFLEISRYPDGKEFAFTITDDPDYSKVDETLRIYEFLENLGFRTTIGVWVLDNKHGSGEGGSLTNTRGLTTNNDKYLRYLKALKIKGFEICLHTVGPGNDLREETSKGYESFKEQFGEYPKINVNHANNLENIYWGKDRFSNIFLRILYGLKRKGTEGHVEGSKYFWGDICRSKTKYVRGLVADEINTLSVNESMPYHLNDKPYVRFWFGCSNGFNCITFNALISDSNIRKLVSERGTCIVYTHFAYGFINRAGNLDASFKEQITKISRLNGWFVPASVILDRFLLLRNIEVINRGDTVSIVNKNAEIVKGLTVLTNELKLYLFNANEWKYSNGEGKIVLGDLKPYEVVKLSGSSKREEFQAPGFLERIKMTIYWILSRREPG
jgi:hypothetical protein